MLLAPPVDYNQIMGRIPLGQVMTISKIREYLAERYGADFTDPITAGILFPSQHGLVNKEKQIKFLSGGH